MKLSICIPTYNRAELLRECLASVIPQVLNYAEVEVIVSDNASPDRTQEVVEEFRGQYPKLLTYRNSKNLGYTGNQVKCFEYASGDYLAILCDDDLYQPGLVDRLLTVLADGEYAFIALNYFSFLSDVKNPFKNDFAPAKDIKFERAYDVMNYPSVGHYSGFVFNTKLGNVALGQALSRRGWDYFEKNRGIISEIAARATAASSYPSFFIGERLLATRMPIAVDYDTINHLCLDYFEFYLNLLNDGVITEADLSYRRRLVLDLLPKAIVVDSYRMTNQDLVRVSERLQKWFGTELRFRFFCRPLLSLAKNAIIKQIFRAAHMLKRKAKYGSAA